MKIFKRHISLVEIATVSVIGLMLIFACGIQICLGGRLWLLMVILAACEGAFLFLILTPLSYRFEEDGVVIVNPRLFGDKRILYSAVIKYDVVGSFLSSQKDFNSIEVILTYRPEGMRWSRTISCHPENVRGFVQLLREKCPDMESVPE